MQEAASDLNAADARHHDSCRKLFMNPKNVRATHNLKDETPNDDATVASLVKLIKLAKDKIWTSTELHSLHLDNGGKDLNQTRMLNKVTVFMGNEVVVLSSPGVASIIMLNDKASQIFKFASAIFNVLVHNVKNKILKMKNEIEGLFLLNISFFNAFL